MSDNNLILIPSTPTDCPLGRVFNNFFIISSTTERVRGDEVVWDFSNVLSMHPFFLFALSLYKTESGKKISQINVSPEMAGFLDSICFDQIKAIDSSEGLQSFFDAGQCYIPVCRFPACEDNMQHLIQTVIQEQSKAEGIATPFAYVMGEIICNVAQHSNSRDVYFSSYFDDKTGMIDFCIADKGIGIYSSFVKANKYLSQIYDNEAEALRLANKGFSTKNRPEAENRGFGISTSCRMVVNGLEGSFSILSGNALQLSAFGHEDVFTQLPREVEWPGTMVFVQIPRKAKEGFRYVDYLE